MHKLLSYQTPRPCGPQYVELARRCKADALFAVFDKNIAALNAAKGLMSMAGVDSVAAITAGQHQMKALSAEIQRSANVGIGYAFSAEHLLADTVFAHAVAP